MTELKLDNLENVKKTITKKQLKEIESLYLDWAKEIGKKAEYYKKKNTSSSVISELQMRQLKRQLEEQSKIISNEISEIIKKGMGDMSEEVIKANKELLEALGFSRSKLSSSFSYVPDSVVKALVAGRVYKSKWSLSKSIWGDNEKTLKDIYTIVAKGRAENKTLYDVAKELESYVNPTSKKKWNKTFYVEDKLGNKKKYTVFKGKVDYNAQRLARTLTQHAYQQSINEVTKDNPFVEKVEWIANGSRVCPICLKRNHKLFDKKHVPMDHPNGMCILNPIFDEDSDKQIADWIKGKENKKIDKFAETLSYKAESLRKKDDKESINVKQKQNKAKASKIKYSIVKKSEYFNWATERNGIKINAKFGKSGEIWSTDFGNSYMAYSDRINKALNEGNYSEFIDNVKIIDSLIEESSLPKSSILYRFVDDSFMKSTFGISSDFEQAKNLVGSVFETKQYLSTTVSYHSAFGTRPVLLQIQEKAGSKVYVSPNASEFELLIGRDKKWEIIDVQDGKNTYFQVQDFDSSSKKVYKGTIITIKEAE